MMAPAGRLTVPLDPVWLCHFRNDFANERPALLLPRADSRLRIVQGPNPSAIGTTKLSLIGDSVSRRNSRMAA